MTYNFCYAPKKVNLYALIQTIIIISLCLSDMISVKEIISVDESIEGIMLSSEIEYIEKGSTINLETFYIPTYDKTNEIIWSSDDTSIASVENGVVYGQSQGHTIITAKTRDGKFITSCEIVVCTQFGVSLKNQEIVIVKYFGDTENIIIPSVIEGYPVTSITKNAFPDCLKYESVIIPPSVKNIDKNAFTNYKHNFIIDCTFESAAYVFALENNMIALTSNESINKNLHNTIKGYIKEMPEFLSNCISSVNIVPAVQSEIKMDKGKAVGQTNTKKEIYIEPNDEIKSNLYHEAGHCLDYTYNYSGGWDNKDRKPNKGYFYEYCYPEWKGIWYLGDSVYEAFAATVADYYVGENLLSSGKENSYKYIKMLEEGKNPDLIQINETCLIQNGSILYNFPCYFASGQKYHGKNINATVTGKIRDTWYVVKFKGNTYYALSQFK